MPELGALELGTEMGRGGQGSVFEIGNWVWPNAPSEAEIEGLVYKQYHLAALESIDIAALESMPTFLERLSPADQVSMLRSVAWPITTVQHESELNGYVMPRISRAFVFERRLAKGTIKLEVATAQFLMNSRAYLKRTGIEVDGRERCAILADLANAVAFLHEHDIVVGDISATNVLWSRAPICRAFVIDADSMAVGGRSATPRVETPDWEAPTAADVTSSASPADDNYKLGLMALRLLTGSMDTRDPDLLAPNLSATRELIQASLRAKPDERPSARQWATHLSELAQHPVELPWLDEPPAEAPAATPTRRPGRSQDRSTDERPVEPKPTRDTAGDGSRTGPTRESAPSEQRAPSQGIPQERPPRPGSNGEPEQSRRRAVARGVAVALGIGTASLLAAVVLGIMALLAGDDSSSPLPPVANEPPRSESAEDSSAHGTDPAANLEGSTLRPSIDAASAMSNDYRYCVLSVKEAHIDWVAARLLAATLGRITQNGDCLLNVGQADEESNYSERTELNRARITNDNVNGLYLVVPCKHEPEDLSNDLPLGRGDIPELEDVPNLAGSSRYETWRRIAATIHLAATDASTSSPYAPPFGCNTANDNTSRHPAEENRRCTNSVVFVKQDADSAKRRDEASAGILVEVLRQQAQERGHGRGDVCLFGFETSEFGTSEARLSPKQGDNTVGHDSVAAAIQSADKFFVIGDRGVWGELASAGCRALRGTSGTRDEGKAVDFLEERYGLCRGDERTDLGGADAVETAKTVGNKIAELLQTR